MKKITNIQIVIAILLVSILNKTNAQEIVLPLKSNPVLFNQKSTTSFAKKRAISLPFIDDFCDAGPYPNQTFWTDKQAYINNTMSATPITRGIATLDGLNAIGRPYFTNPNSVGYADSLTSQPIDLSSYTPSNNIYLSFFYQPQGLGFSPESTDSLMLFAKNKQQNWIPLWKIKGTTIQPFKYMIFPITDTQFLHADFQFRFVNIASLNVNNDTWNIDYVKLDANRSFTDTLNSEIAFTNQPTSMLYPYSSMPYRHFIVNQANEKAGAFSVFLQNYYAANHTVAINHVATEKVSNTAITSSVSAPVSVPLKSSAIQNFNNYTISYTAPNNFSKVEIEDKFFYNPVNTIDRKQNDTIRQVTTFDNYFAYDDGSAEKSYFLLPAFNFPSKTALEFHLNQTDTVRGVMVNFGPQLPSGAGKLFSIVLYQQLAGNGLSDSIITQEDFNSLMYVDSINGFSSYAFATPKVLNAGTYYVGITQPANFGSDSIYYGLDVNNNSNLQHLYYNVDGTWYASITQGSIMMRPIVGEAFTPTNTTEIVSENSELLLFPNPIENELFIQTKHTICKAIIYDLVGKIVAKPTINNNTIQLQNLHSGMYIIELLDEKNTIFKQKFYKK